MNQLSLRCLQPLPSKIGMHFLRRQKPTSLISRSGLNCAQNAYKYLDTGLTTKVQILDITCTDVQCTINCVSRVYRDTLQFRSIERGSIAAICKIKLLPSATAQERYFAGM